MRLLCFQARSFRWRSFVQTLEVGSPGAATGELDGELSDCLVVFAHAERADEPDAARSRAFKQTLKHVKWLANKRDLKSVVLHSFAHLGGDHADPAVARGLLADLAARLGQSGYTVACTPFGHSCEWDLAVHGDNIAKVYKQI